MTHELPVNRKVMAALLLAALACVADVPRIAAALIAPDAIGAQRALDLVLASRMQQRLAALPAGGAEARELATGLDHDRESAHTLNRLPCLQAVLPSSPRLQVADAGPSQPQSLPLEDGSSPALLWPVQLLHLPPPPCRPPGLRVAAEPSPAPACVRGRSPPAAL